MAHSLSYVRCNSDRSFDQGNVRSIVVEAELLGSGNYIYIVCKNSADPTWDFQEILCNIEELVAA